VDQQMNFDISIIESDSEIRSLILEAMRSHLDIAFNKSISEIREEIKRIFIEGLKKEPEYESLMSGSLKFEFGIPDSTAIDRVIVLMADTLEINKVPITASNFGLTGGYKMTMIKSDDINGIIKDEAATVQDDARGYVLPWLDWLLFQSNKPIVKDFEVRLGPNNNSRTGMAIMVDSNKNWRVPPQFAGSITNNWTTRAIENMEKEILKIMQTSIEKNI
jgi:hypothetical protein